MRTSLYRALLLPALSLIFTAGPAFALLTVTTASDENDVPSGAALSLREAVRDAATGESIGFDPALDGQVIVLTGSGMSVTGRTLTVDASALAGGLVLQMQTGDRHFSIAAGAALDLRGLTLQGRAPSTANALSLLGGGF